MLCCTHVAHAITAVYVFFKLAITHEDGVFVELLLLGLALYWPALLVLDVDDVSVEALGIIFRLLQLTILSAQIFNARTVRVSLLAPTIRVHVFQLMIDFIMLSETTCKREVRCVERVVLADRADYAGSRKLLWHEGVFSANHHSLIRCYATAVIQNVAIIYRRLCLRATDD